MCAVRSRLEALEKLEADVEGIHTHIPPVDVSERNSGNSPVEVGSLSHYFPGFIQPKGWLGMEFLKHQLRMEGRWFKIGSFLSATFFQGMFVVIVPGLPGV